MWQFLCIFRRWCVLLLVLAPPLLSPADAEVPGTMSIQGVLQNADGSLVADGPHELTFTLYDAATGGTAQWTESASTVQVEGGLFEGVLGQSVPLTSAVVDEPRWLGIAVGGATELAPRLALRTVPYSLVASAVEGERGELGLDSAGAGGLVLDGLNGNTNVLLSILSGAPDFGAVSVHDADGNDRGVLAVDAPGNGFITLRGLNGNRNVLMSGFTDAPNRGIVVVYDADDNFRGLLSVSNEGSGSLDLWGPNGSKNVTIGTPSEDLPNNGFIGIRNASGELVVAILASEGGRGEITATGVISAGILAASIKNFVAPNPNDPGTEIWYASVEGPEAAAYVRGTATLTNGRAQVHLPDHFRAVTVEEGMTVQVTPLSASSKGLAVTQKRLEGIVVEELFQGTGNYNFDWEVKCVRRGFEEYQVIRPAREETVGAPAGL